MHSSSSHINKVPAFSFIVFLGLYHRPISGFLRPDPWVWELCCAFEKLSSIFGLSPLEFSYNSSSQCDKENYFFETESYYVIKLPILGSSLWLACLSFLECWDYRHILPCQAAKSALKYCQMPLGGNLLLRRTHSWQVIGWEHSHHFECVGSHPCSPGPLCPCHLGWS